MRATNRFKVILATLLLGFISAQSFAQSDNANPAAFGIGKPAKITDLPQGALRARLQSLPPQARSRALRWLQDFSFPEADLDTLQIDDEGNVFYADTILPDPEKVKAAKGADTPTTEAAPASTLDDAFLLHSRSGAPNRVFVDFDGDIITGTAWNGSVSQYDALPYDLDGDISTFNSTERTNIVDIWHRIAEDLAPFDIDVTTEEPAVFDRYTGHILITKNKDANGVNMPSSGGGGVAYVGVFGNSSYNYYSPALVYYNNLGSGQSTYSAEASSHEFGHNLGLSHDGISGGTSYYAGHGTGLVSWAPIMGNSYNKNVTEYSKGEYPNANQTQDDLALIDLKLGYRPDDHGDTRATATGLLVDGAGSVVSSNPETDPHNFLPENKGIINASTDVDVFSFTTGTGDINLTINPAWDAFYRATSRRGANLDIEAELQDLNGAQVALSDPLDDTRATILNTPVSSGTYFLLITGVGNAVTPYSDYDSLGQYFINGTVPSATTDQTPPTPDPMTWASVPAAVDAYSITMTASTATDSESLPVQYYFVCQASSGTGCVPSGWQTGTTHTATGLSPSTSYTYVVRARDAVFNVGGDSVAESATTNQAPPADPTNLVGTAVSVAAIDLTWSDNSNDEAGFKLERRPDGQGSWDLVAASLAPNTVAYSDSGLAASTLYNYRLSAFNTAGSSGFASASATTQDLPPDGTPGGLSATMFSASAIDVVWTDVATNASSFVIQQSTAGSGGSWTDVGSVGPDVRVFQATVLSANTEYWYQVYASNGGGNSLPSNVDSAITDFECTANITLPSGEWVFFSLPCMPPDPSAGAIFSAGPTVGNYGTRWVIYKYDSTALAYQSLLAGEALVEGKGYLLYTLDAFAPAKVGGSFNAGGPIPLVANANPGVWNLVGNPYNATTTWPAISVRDTTKSYGWSSMDKKNGKNPYYCEKTPSVDNKCITWHVMNKWENNVYVPYNGLTGDPGTLAPFDAMWVRSHRSISITIPPPAATLPAPLEAAPSLADAPGTKPARGNKGGNRNSAGAWQVRLVAASGRYRDAGNWLGQDENAADGLDSRDLEEWTPFSSPYLSILFTNPLFDTVDWGYTRDFRKLTSTQQGEWPFVVRASSGINEVTLSWQGAAGLFDNALLINDISGEVITIVPGGSYTFDMVGNEHPFRIIFN